MQIVVKVTVISLVASWNICHAAEHADLAWPELNGNHSDIYYNAYRKGKWTGKVRVSDPRYNNMHPEMAVVNDDSLFLVWTAVDGFRNKLFFAVKSKDGWGAAQEIETGMQSSIGPVIILDVAGIPWIAWAGNDGGLDEIFVSSWNGKNWSSPVQVNPSNEVPDILPEISLSVGGNLLVTWQKYDNYEYRYYQSELHDGRWNDPVLLQNENVLTKKAVVRKSHGNVPFPHSFNPLKNEENVYDFQVR